MSCKLQVFCMITDQLPFFFFFARHTCTRSFVFKQCLLYYIAIFRGNTAKAMWAAQDEAEKVRKRIIRLRWWFHLLKILMYYHNSIVGSAELSFFLYIVWHFCAVFPIWWSTPRDKKMCIVYCNTCKVHSTRQTHAKGTFVWHVGPISTIIMH